jgi:apolipoprotein N-acyltransferase
VSARAWPRSAELGAAAAVGALHTLAYVQPGAWWLQLAAAALLAWRAAANVPRRAAAIGLAFGAGWLGAGVWWLFVSMHRYGGLPAWMAAAAVAALACALGLYLAAALAAFAHWRRGRLVVDALLFASVWMLAELARGVLFTGFPWIASGYAHVDSPLAALAPWVGVYGIGFGAALLAALVALPRAAAGRIGGGLAAAAVLVGLASTPRPEFTRPTRTLAVTLLQGNVAQNEKFSLEYLPGALAWTAQALDSARGELVVAPETVIPLLPAQLDPAYWDSVVAPFRSGARAALIGLPLGDEKSGYTNSAAGLSAASAALPGGFYRYDKFHLVPFGEFIPPGFRWFTEMMDIPLGDFARGVPAAPSFEVRGERIAPNICYEDLFGEELAARFADPQRAPTILANVSNIGWFGKTIAVDQHLNISRMRTLELQRPMLRATNTGATAVVDHRGVVRYRLAPHTQGLLDGKVQGREGNTPFARWAAAAGLWPPALLALAIVLAAAALPRRGALSDPAAPAGPGARP